MKNEVAIKKIDSYEPQTIESALTEVFNALGCNKFFTPNLNVLIKIDAGVDANPDMAQTTNPAVVQAVINIVSGFGAKCTIVDSPIKQYTENNLEKIYFETGMLEVANSSKCELNHNLKVCKLEIPNGVKTKSALLLEVVKKADAIINIGKIKVDKNLGFLASSAGLFGFVPGEMKQIVLNRLTTVDDFNNYIIDIASRLQNKLVLNVLDGVVALENNQSQRMTSCIAAAENMFSLDAVASKIIGMDLNDTIVKTAANRGMIDINNPYKLLIGDLNELTLVDFDFGEKTRLSNIFSSKAQQKHFFNQHQQRVTINPKKCKGCGRCASICPANAITMKIDKNGELFAKVDYSKCIFCKKCYTACPYSVVNLKTPIGYKMINHSVTKFNKQS